MNAVNTQQGAKVHAALMALACCGQRKSSFQISGDSKRPSFSNTDSFDYWPSNQPQIEESIKISIPG